MGGVTQVACCVTSHKQEDNEEDDEQAAIVEQKPLFERTESFARGIPAEIWKTALIVAGANTLISPSATESRCAI